MSRFPAVQFPSGGEPGPAGPSPRGKSRSTPAPRLLAAALAGALLGVGGFVALGANSAHAGANAVLSATAPITAVPQNPAAYTGGIGQASAVATQVEPAIVDINTVFRSASGSGTAAGTGIILTANGEILTNNHVVEGATSITIDIPGHSGSYPAQVLGVDPTADVALIQVAGVSGLPTATLAGSATLRTDQSVVAVGNAGGVGGTPSVSQGSIVALGQSITATGDGTPEQLTDLIQSNATIAPGDSGGALVNSAGQVVGMITAGQTNSRGGATNVGFAIPISDALTVVNQVRAGQGSSTVILGQVGYLGITVTDLNPTVAAQLGLSGSSGALVMGVTGGSPADQAGIARYSVIDSVAGGPIASTSDLGNALHAYRPGDQVQVTWTDQVSASHTAMITLTTGPAL
ncbi:MAG TPA: trypsin-like peptidase domain-containing protein [Candidatus Dormibacteraeota bacterium]|nr:trypsin-like peptidase domain-containing protein [Candidatus Dormibacteraeota bacterium]